MNDEYLWKLHNTQEELSKLLDELEKLRDRWSLNKRVFCGINLAIDELMTNLIMYGKKNRDVSILLKNAEDEVEITYIDNCDPFNPFDVPAPDVTLDCDVRADGGLGLFLVKKKSKFLDYKREDGKNCIHIILSKNLECCKPNI